MFYNQNEIYTSPITSKSNEDLDYEFEGFTEKDYFPDNEKQNIKNVENDDVFYDCYIISADKINDKIKQKTLDGSDLNIYNAEIHNVDNIRANADKAITLYSQNKIKEAEAIIPDFQNSFGNYIKKQNNNVIVTNNIYPSICQAAHNSIYNNSQRQIENTADTVVSLLAQGKSKEADKILPGISYKYDSSSIQQINNIPVLNKSDYNNLCDCIETKFKATNALNNIDKIEENIHNNASELKFYPTNNSGFDEISDLGFYSAYYAPGLLIEKISRESKKSVPNVIKSIEKEYAKEQPYQQNDKELNEFKENLRSLTELNYDQFNNLSDDDIAALNASVDYAHSLSNKELDEHIKRMCSTMNLVKKSYSNLSFEQKNINKDDTIDFFKSFTPVKSNSPTATSNDTKEMLKEQAITAKIEREKKVSQNSHKNSRPLKQRLKEQANDKHKYVFIEVDGRQIMIRKDLYDQKQAAFNTKLLIQNKKLYDRGVTAERNDATAVAKNKMFLPEQRNTQKNIILQKLIQKCRN